MTPFLYNTKTLSRLARAGATTLRAGLHTTAGRRAADYDIPFELPSDLHRDAPKVHSSISLDSLTPNEREIFGNIFNEIERTGKKPRVATTPAPQPPASKAKVEAAPPQPQFLAGLLDGPVSATSEPADPVKAAATINSIMEDALHQASGTQRGLSGLDPLSPLQATNSASEREKALLLFPPTLRKAARRAFGMLEAGDSGPQALVQTEGGGSETVAMPPQEPSAGARRSEEPLAKTVETEARRRHARLKILKSMQACTTDFEVWKVMEKNVFPLVKQLGISDIPENVAIPPPGVKARKGRMKREKELAEASKAAAQAAAAAVKAGMNSPSDRASLDMAIYGPMYPQLLIDGLNILGTKFPRPSPYMMHLLPRIKELGLVSYVLGVSTAFYNRLILIIWERYGDATTVMSLLEEMRHAGLRFDEDSLSVVSQIEAVYSQAEAGQRGHFVQGLMGAPEFEPLLVQRLTHWTGYIIANLRG